MQILWMLMITLALALSGVLGLAVVTHAAREDQAPADPTPKPSPTLHGPPGGGRYAEPIPLLARLRTCLLYFA
jgi:hypothetical protein